MAATKTLLALNANVVLAVAPSNREVIYAGSGEAGIRNDFETGAVIYRTSGGGKTRHYAGLRETHTTAALAIDPKNARVVFTSRPITARRGVA